MTTEPDKTGKNRKPGTFTKGDKRINRKGRPPGVDSFAQLRKEYQRVWSEVLYDDKGKPLIDAETGEKLTRLTARLRISTSSRNVQEFITGLAYAYGKPKEEVENSGEITLVVKYQGKKKSTDES